MEIKAITFEDRQFDTVTVVMSAEEAAFVAKVVGKMNDPMAHSTFGMATQAHSEIYDALSGEVFNRLYDEGVDGWIRQ